MGFYLRLNGKVFRRFRFGKKYDDICVLERFRKICRGESGGTLFRFGFRYRV